MQAGATLPRRASELRRPPAPGRVRGLYSGGTLCTEAAAIVGDGEFTDFGDDEYTRGPRAPDDRPVAADRGARAGRARSLDPVLLLDVVLGYGAHPDPAGSWRR